MPDDFLPRSAALALWINSHLAGRVSLDDAATAIRGQDPHHLVVGLAGDEGLPLTEAISRLRPLLDSVALALPVPGDPVGLGGPADFNLAALESGEAVALVGTSYGLVPEVDARTVLWRLTDAAPVPYVDSRETALQLQQTLLEVTQRLVAMDVASWQPEIPDLLMNLRHRPPPPLPPGVEQRRAEAIDRALVCLEVVDLARCDDGGALSAGEAQARMAALEDLDRASRRALVGACSQPAR